MATTVAFSAQGNRIVVEGTLQEVNELLAVGRRAGSGLCQLTRVPARLERHFEPTPVLVNPEKVAYVCDEIV